MLKINGYDIPVKKKGLSADEIIDEVFADIGKLRKETNIKHKDILIKISHDYIKTLNYDNGYVLNSSNINCPDDFALRGYKYKKVTGEGILEVAKGGSK